MARSQRDKAFDGIAISRIVVGASAYLAPSLSGRLFGLDPAGNPQASYLGRLFGARDVALGAGVLRAHKKQKQMWAAAGVACDFADIGAGVMAGARGQLPPAAAAMVTGTAAVFALAGTWLLQQ